MTSRPTLLARRIALVVGLLVGPGLVVTAAPTQAYTPSATTVAAFEARVIYQINVQRASSRESDQFVGIRSIYGIPTAVSRTGGVVKHSGDVSEIASHRCFDPNTIGRSRRRSGTSLVWWRPSPSGVRDISAATAEHASCPHPISGAKSYT